MRTQIRTLLREVAQRSEVINNVREILRSLLDQARSLLNLIEDVSEASENSEGHLFAWEQRVQGYWEQTSRILDGLSTSVTELGDGEQEGQTMDSITKVREMIEDIVNTSFALLRGENLLVEWGIFRQRLNQLEKERCPPLVP